MKFYAIVILLFTLLIQVVLPSQDAVKESAFPTIEVENLQGRAQKLELSNKATSLILIGSELSAINQAKEWLSEIKREKLINKNTELYVMAAIGNSFKARCIRPLVLYGLKKEVPLMHHEKVFLVTKAMPLLTTYLGGISRHVHLLLVDKEGTIQWQHQGEANTESKKSLKKATSNLA